MEGQKRHPKTRVGELIIEVDQKYFCGGLLKNVAPLL